MVANFFYYTHDAAELSESWRCCLSCHLDKPIAEFASQETSFGEPDECLLRDECSLCSQIAENKENGRDSFELLMKVVGIQARLIKQLYSIEQSPQGLNRYYSKFVSEFTVEKVLGSGGFAEVTLCKNKVDGQLYAVKRIDVENKGDDAKFAREFQLLSTMDHPNIIRYYAAWYEDHFGAPLVERSSTFSESTRGSNCEYELTKVGFKQVDETKDWIWREGDNVNESSSENEHIEIMHRIYIRMEFCNMDLRAYMKEKSLPDLMQKYEHIFTAVLRGLEYIHGMKIFHRDIKPGNILINLDPFQVKLADFGLARRQTKVAESTESQFPLTPEKPSNEQKTNVLASSLNGLLTSDIGSLLYIAPEQGTGGKGYGPKSDIYSTGLVMFELVCCKEWLTNQERVMAFREFQTKRSFPKLTKTLKGQDSFGHMITVHYSRSLISRMVHPAPKMRPSAEEALNSLREYSESAQRSPPDYHSCSSYYLLSRVRTVPTPVNRDLKRI